MKGGEDWGELGGEMSVVFMNILIVIMLRGNPMGMNFQKYQLLTKIHQSGNDLQIHPITSISTVLLPHPHLPNNHNPPPSNYIFHIAMDIVTKTQRIIPEPYAFS
jgi:hypothetical protein